MRPELGTVQAGAGALEAADRAQTRSTELQGASAASFARSIKTAGIVGIGVALPKHRVGNDELAASLGLSDGWIERRTGIVERRYAAPGERVSDLATRAGKQALDDAHLAADQLDLVLVATLAGDEITPGPAPTVAHELGATRAAAIDIGAACAGALAALSLGAAWIESRRARHVLVVGSEILSRFIDMEDRRTAHLFGDAAGALVLSADAPGQIGPIVLSSDGAGAEMIHAPRSSGLLEMDGHQTFLAAVEHLHACTRQVLDVAGVELGAIDLFVYHQGNSRILGAVADRLGVSRGKVFDCIAMTGNTSAASIPLALAEARRTGALQPGMQIVVGAVGAGLTWGAAVVRWGQG